ncbi:MAG: amino acid permease [Salinibacter sp.]
MFYPDLWFNVTAEGASGGMGLEQLQPFIPDETGWAGVFSAMGLTFIAFEGYEIIVQAGEEVTEPRKNIPKAVFWSLAIVVPTYMLVAFVLVGGTNSAFLLEALRQMGEAIPEGVTAASQNWEILGHLGELGLAHAASQFVPYGALLILVGGMVSTMSALNATTFSSTRVSFAMGRDRNLPDMFAEVHPRTRTPYFAVMWSAALICFMVAFVPITTVAAAADIMFLLLFLQVNVAVITLRKKYGDKLAYGYLMPFYPVVPIIGIVTKLGLALFMFDHYPVAWVYVLIWLAVGFVIYRFYAYGRERKKEAPPVAYEERALTPKEHSVLIPVADPEAARQFIHLGAWIAKARDSELVLLHAERIPHQLPASAAGEYIQESRPVLDEAREYAEQFDVPVSTMSRLARDVSDAIVHTAEDKNTDYLIMGWRGDIHGEETQIGDNIDHVLKAANTHSIVMQRGTVGTQERILVPVANPETAPLAIAVGGLLYDEGGPEVKLLHVTPEPMSNADREAFRDQLLAFIKDEETEPQGLVSNPGRFDFEVVEAEEPAEEIVRRSGNYERIVLGTSRGGYFRRKVFGQFPLRIAGQARCPVVFVRPREPGYKYGIQQFFQFFQELETSGSPKETESP